MANNNTPLDEQENRELCYRIGQIARGDHGAFRLFFEAYYPRLLSFANSLTKDRLMAEEVVEEVFVKIWNARQQLEQVGQIESYCFRAVHNQALTALKKQKKHLAQMVPFADQPFEPIAPNPTDEALLTDELNKIVSLAIENLPERCRLVFDLVKGEQLRYREVAARLGITEKTVERQVGIALRKIAQAVQEYQNERTKPGNSGTDSELVSGAICLVLFLM
jgi:RNA polymerase sigma-70 factor (ECF subfamily)